jgi:hypothetical protein
VSIDKVQIKIEQADGIVHCVITKDTLSVWTVESRIIQLKWEDVLVMRSLSLVMRNADEEDEEVSDKKRRPYRDEDDDDDEY